MPFNNIDEIKKQFGLFGDNLEEMRRELRKLAGEIHPDKNVKGGLKFKSKEDEERYYKINEAKTFIDNLQNKQKALVPLSQVTDELIKVVEKLVPSYKKNSLTDNLSKQIESNITEIKVRHRFPKITLTALAAFLTFLWVLPYQVYEHPVIGKYITANNPVFTMIWLTSIAITFFMWVILGIKEHRCRELLLQLTTETFQNNLFKSFIRENPIHKKDKFSKENFINFLVKVYRITSIENPFFKLTSPIDIETAHHLANTIFSRIEEKQIIKKVDTKSLSDYYILNVKRNEIL